MYHSIDQRLTDALRWALHSTPRFMFIGRVRFKCDSNKFQDRARWCGHVYISGFKSQITHGLTLIVVINYLILVKPLLGSSWHIMQESSVEAHHTKRKANLAEGDKLASSEILTCCGEETVNRWWMVAERLTVDGKKWKLSYSVFPFERQKKK